MEVKIVESWDDFFYKECFFFQKDYYKIPLVFS